jgi:hypothetical protein
MPSILYKTEDAIESILNGAESLEGVGIHRGGDNEKFELPFITITAEKADERQPRRNGNFTVICKVELHTSMDDKDRDEKIALTDALIDLLDDDDLKDVMTEAIDDYTAFGALTNSHAQRISNRAHIYEIELEIHCNTVDAEEPEPEPEPEPDEFDPIYVENVINGLPVVRFTGSQALKIADNLALYGAHVSFFFVGRIKTSSGSTWWLERNQNPGETGSWLFGNTLGQDVMSFYSNSDATHTKSSFVPSDLTAFLQTTIYNGSTVANRHNGSADTTNPDSGGGDLIDNGGDITIGGMQYYGGDSGFQVDIAELLFYTTDVSSGDRNSIEGYLLNKYGLGSGSAFDPSTVANLQVWLKADAITGKNDGDAVVNWPDSSGNDNDAVTLP